MSAQAPSLAQSQIRRSLAGSQYLSWGRYPRHVHKSVFKLSWVDQAPALLMHAEEGDLLPFGLGRSYGDVCLNEERALVDCSGLDHFLEADFEQGWITCEAGVSLAQILDLVIPRGWFLPVTPGTQFVTIGGAIANDVHGKNHHRAGTFGCHVRKLTLCRSDRGVVVCSPAQNPDLFRATIGGLGLTGVILSAEIALKRIAGSEIAVETAPFRSLQEFISLTDESDETHEYTVAWVDSLSSRRTRGIFFRGNHADLGERQYGPAKQRRPDLPFEFPDWVLNPASARALNAAYYLSNSWRKRTSIVPYHRFFYPLDSINHWNRAYGKRGFLQHQCVIPTGSVDAIENILRLTSRYGAGSFLAVLKQFGSRTSPGMLSFPRPGLTLALDFPMRGEQTLKLLEKLDRIVLDCGGALYPAKDARMSPEMFEASFPQWRQFAHWIDERFSSSFWRRVTGNSRCAR